MFGGATSAVRVITAFDKQTLFFFLEEKDLIKRDSTLIKIKDKRRTLDQRKG